MTRFKLSRPDLKQVVNQNPVDRRGFSSYTVSHEMAFGAEVNRATESAEYHRTFLIALITVRGELAACTTDSAFARAVKPSVDLYKNLR